MYTMVMKIIKLLTYFMWYDSETKYNVQKLFLKLNNI